ncbi:juvenile hormone-binding protein-like [Anticarsia gemmatalis]|uniref:juvenile hormone-binding protein-like n=1 Tax=Anticarsia gemmatalis TaxID=129554 RepID=UPI003F75EF8B
MPFLKVTLIFALFVSTFAKLPRLFHPCYSNDLPCLNNATHSFLSKTFRGYPSLRIKPVDPLIIPSLHTVVLEGNNMIRILNRDIQVVKLRNQELVTYKINKRKKTILLELQVDLAINSNITIGYYYPKTASGSYFALAVVKETFLLDYEINDQNHFEIQPSWHQCNVVGTSYVEMKDEEGRKMSGLTNDQDRALICSIVDWAFATVIDNLRTVARVYPKSAFLIDI